MTPTKIQLAYMAGYLDGEGCLGWYNTPTLILETCHPGPLKFVRSFYGGEIKSRRRTGEGQSKRTIYRLCYYADNCLAILNQVTPYLIEKKEQAQSILEVKRLREKLKSEKKVDHGKTQLAKR
jgi:hypothetical protein